jgi:hypothetical protein
MRWNSRLRIVLSFLVLLTILAGSFGLRFGIRHRHEGGEAAHSHGHGHTHSHSHTRSHSHTAGHSHAHSHGSSHSHDTPETSDSHIHVTFFGVQLTLPDFGFTEPAPLVSLTPNAPSAADSGERVELPCPFALAGMLQLWMDQTAIAVTRVSINKQEQDPEAVTVAAEVNLGRDASPPPLPPPRNNGIC